MDQIERAKRLLESKGYRVEEPEYVFEGIDEKDVIPLNEFIDMHGDEYAWEESLEEVLAESELAGDQLKEYEVGDIIMPMKAHSTSSEKEVSPHKILLIQSKKLGDDGVIQYKGFLLSSKIQKSNKYSHYANNIYIADYSTILHRGVKDKKEAFIRVDDIVEFTNQDLDTRGVWKGKASYKFMRFVNNCYLNYKLGKDNSQRYWE